MSEIHKMYDEKGEEYVVVWGGINDGKITARAAVLIGGPCPTLSPETQDFGKALATYPYRFRSRLYRSGRVDNMRGDFPENELHKVVKAVQDLYDELWPDVAQKMRDFERKALTSFNMTRAELPVKFIKAVIAKSGRSLLDLLKVVERNTWPMARLKRASDGSSQMKPRGFFVVAFHLKSIAGPAQFQTSPGN